MVNLLDLADFICLYSKNIPMNKTIKTILILGIIGLITGGTVGYFMYNKPHANVAGMEADYVLSAAQLYEQVLAKDETAADEFADKIFEVSGKLAKLEMTSDTTANVFMTIEGAEMSNVIGSMDAEFVAAAQSIKVGDDVVLKGIFAGVNKFEDPDFGISTTDIQLTRCVLPEK